ncbi:hypothetical protein NLD30_07030 [SCandidatus Aminicenantes bacterium Aminicenantia_JdfR_composite]|jgi:hypothetical protein|nr:hypothetical protein [SCandidatus Aminicenantes bacterium Aminicenantia_JdfR_composite]MCP2596641.1 hypothetical protein [Candidatus Aminicenantes bacterium AC-335-G13]MCP2598033.1 hypothetical protein [Candidatus Aminicenantes bacterium AC-335-L06]
MPEKLICPLLLVGAFASNGSAGITSENFIKTIKTSGIVQCLEKECAWYIKLEEPKFEGCIMGSLSDLKSLISSLTKIECSLNALRPST